MCVIQYKSKIFLYVLYWCFASNSGLIQNLNKFISLKMYLSSSYDYLNYNIRSTVDLTRRYSKDYTSLEEI